MLISFVILYLLFSIGIGIYASTRVHNSRDFVVAGRNLPLPVVTATVFATWFGAETVLGIPATFVTEGLSGVVADPFGASMCLIIAGLFFAGRLYRMDLLTIGDYYRARYNRTVELIMTVCIMISYLGWVAAQVTALGLVFNMVSGGAIEQSTGMVIGTAIVLAYTVFGGMWSIALLDFVQMTVIMAALLLIGVLVSGEAGGVNHVVSHAQTAGKLQFFPQGGYEVWIPFIGAALTMMLGSIPQQDVFQRITSAKNEKTAVRGAVLGGVLYFGFAFVPMFLVYAATLIDPKVFGDLIETDTQMVLPSLILLHTPLVAQVFFFGALLSAIMSTASATLLAPSVMFTENILKHFVFPHMSDKQMLRTIRIIMLTFGCIVLWFALDSNESIFKM
ncbi:MAG: sodium:solute symporter family protein, partial [Gallionella sp.]|nr:sodium:solute symporter family protein [Gallionella sp.]